MHKGLLLCVSFSFQSDSFYLIYLENLREALGSGEGIGTDSYWMYYNLNFVPWRHALEILHTLSYINLTSLRKWVIISLSSEVTLPYITQWVISWEKTAKSLLFPLYHFSRIKYNSIFYGHFLLANVQLNYFSLKYHIWSYFIFLLIFTFIHCY